MLRLQDRIRALRMLVRRHPRLKRAILRTPGVNRLVHWAFAPGALNYARWAAQFDTLEETDRAAIRAHIASLPARPRIAVVMPAYETPEPFLRASIESVRAQLWPEWQLCIADDASPSPHVGRVLASYAGDPRIRVVRRERNGHISAATNSALALVDAEWVALMDHDDTLPEHALYRVALEILAHPDAQVIYSDEDKLDDRGDRCDPYFKPDFDPDLLLGQNLVSHLGVYRTALLRQLGGLREGFEGSQDYDLVLRATRLAGPGAVRHIPAVLYHWRQQAADWQSFSEAQLERCVQAARRAITDHLQAAGQGEAKVGPATMVPSWNRVVRPLPEPAPLVTAIIPTRDQAALLERCVTGLLHETDYPALEVLILDNGSVEPATRALFERLCRDSRVRVLPMPGPFNYSRLNNLGVQAARGSVVALLNNDVEVLSKDWLREMVSHAVRPEIGAVGARLLYPDGRVQHAGVVLGVGGVANHFHQFAPRSSPGYRGALALVRRVSAVTGACLVVRRESYLAVGGLDEENLPVAFNDVDFCLRLGELGLANLFTPFAELVHHESVSRGQDLTPEKRARFVGEVEYMLRRWGPLLERDPFYNPNFSRMDSAFTIRPPGREAKPWASFLPRA